MIVLSDMLVQQQQQQQKRKSPPPPPPVPAPHAPSGLGVGVGLHEGFDSRLLNIELVDGKLIVEADPSFVILLLIILLILR
jgi:hypothetical protein